MSQINTAPFTALPLNQKRKAELQAFASAMGLNSNATVPVLRSDIQKHLHDHPELADDPKYLSLLTSRSGGVPTVKTSALKAAEEGLGGPITPEVKTDPPGQLAKLSLSDRTPIDTGSAGHADDHSEFELSSEAGVSPVLTEPVQPPVPPPVPHNPGLPPAAANVPGVILIISHISELVHVNFFDMNRPQDQPSEVPVLSSNVRISTEVNTGNGQVEYVASLAQLLPAAFQNASPIKERGGRIYRPNFRGAAAPLHIGKVEAIAEGTAKPLQLQVVDSYTLRHTNGDLFCDVFVDNTERVAAGNSTEDAALGGALSNDGPAEVPHPIEQPPEFTGAGSDIPLQIARARAANNTVSHNWPRATTAGIVLERYMVEEQVVEFLRPWSRSSGGYVFPAESSVHRMHAGWSNLADLVNDFTGNQRKLTYRQSQQLFVEHFSRPLLLFHSRENFSCDAHPSTRSLAEAVRAEIGVNGGILESAMTHGCTNCTHLKRYRSDLAAAGANFGQAQGVAGLENEEIEMDPPPAGEANFIPPPQQDSPPPGEPRGYVRLAVMDGKNHSSSGKKCALDQCEEPLVNYKNGRFCEGHLNLQNVCGIVPCGLPVRSPGALTCSTEPHIQWHREYNSRFARLSFPGVRRVIRRQQGHRNTGGNHGPTLEVSLPPLGDTPGNEVVHTFKAGSTYCLQTVQWACGYPVGWGKCYRSESSPQVLGILNRFWANSPTFKPSFIAYDDACNLLRHLITQNSDDPWIVTTKFIVDAWHYIHHRSTDILCRLWCNPAPRDGSQPDLILVEEDSDGVQHETRAFDTETAEQLNSWLNGFESQLRHMSDVNYDFFVHVLLMIYAERVDKHVASKDLHLTEEFWAEAIGD
ncbi:hypothetical protein R3P38DRAFT_3326656 [Favolaschia claudopus]|uniref:CxC6 like cysteine cluster associated with KDZ domain-containing protein n=1 Tax=Favolaschia claudopus TaxID=2862362 RepID=A0AAW0A8F4_9AGAR